LIGPAAGGWATLLPYQPETEFLMEAWILVGLILGVVLLDILSLRYGSDSRPEWENPHDWS
jgi:hypothetical protein